MDTFRQVQATNILSVYLHVTNSAYQPCLKRTILDGPRAPSQGRAAVSPSLPTQENRHKIYIIYLILLKYRNASSAKIIRDIKKSD
jgi:hypothetical protein